MREGILKHVTNECLKEVDSVKIAERAKKMENGSFQARVILRCDALVSLKRTTVMRP